MSFEESEEGIPGTENTSSATSTEKTLIFFGKTIGGTYQKKIIDFFFGKAIPKKNHGLLSVFLVLASSLWPDSVAYSFLDGLVTCQDHFKALLRDCMTKLKFVK